MPQPVPGLVPQDPSIDLKGTILKMLTHSPFKGAVQQSTGVSIRKFQTDSQRLVHPLEDFGCMCGMIVASN